MTGADARTLRALARRALPRSVRIEVARLRRWPIWVLERRSVARARGEPADFPFVLARHASPLRRPGTSVDPALQRGKEHNVRVAAGRLDRVRVEPGQVLSYHHLVGRPSRLRGFVPGLELHDGQPSRGVGGGCCQVSNLLYLLALRGGMKIVERHRHALDLFPDAGRTVPFGCGATVFYNYADLRFENPLAGPVLLTLAIEEGMLVGALRAPADPGFTVEVYEVDHRFFQEGGAWYRENRIRRRIRGRDGEVLADQEVAHNRGRVLYEPPVDAS